MAKFLDRLSQAFQKNQTVSSFRVGAIVNERFRVDEEIGRGGMGIVYRAHDLRNDRDVALKMINLDTANALTLAQFSREIEITTRLSHPHIVTAHQAGTVATSQGNTAPFIVMELLKGKSLAEVSGLTYAMIVDNAKQICDALGYIHEQSIVYRDLKPGNIILEKRGFGYFIKLLDFGLARPRGEAYLPNESNLAGTVFYLAPELIAGQPADVGSDLYALGAVLYEMITGRVPFSDIDERNVIKQHVEEKASPPSASRGDVPPALDVIVMRLLEKNPRDRYPSARDVLTALEQVRSTVPLPLRGNLPIVPPTVDEEKTENVIRLVEEHQLVTIVGQDDALALAVGLRMQSQFTGGVWLLDVISVDEPMMLMPTLVNVLGIRNDGQRSQMVVLLEHLREKQFLLILKRCDLLLFACAQLTETILRSCPEAHILATSCQSLKVSGEHCVDG